MFPLPPDPRTDEVHFECPPHPSVSIVLCTHGLRPSLARCLDSLLDQGCQRCEILLVLNGDPDPTLHQALTRYPIRILNEPRRGVCVARNHAIPRARGDILAFVDDDIAASPEWLHALLKGFEDPAVACVTGRVIPVGLGPLSAERQARYFNCERVLSSWTLDTSDSDCWQKALEGPAGFGCNMAFRRAFLENYSLFPEDLGAGSLIGSNDEPYMFVQVLRHGFRILHAPSAVVTHFFEEDDAIRKQRARQLHAAGVAFALKLIAEQDELRWATAKWLMRAVAKRARRILGLEGSLSETSEPLRPLEKIGAYLHGFWMFVKSRQNKLSQHPSL